MAEAQERQDGDDSLRLLSRVAPLFALAYGLLWLFQLDLGKTIPRDGTTLVVGRDFLNFWMAGRAAWGPDAARFYDLATYQAEVAKVTGPGYLGQVWSYPPSIMLLAAPFGRLPYLAGLLLWTLIGPVVLHLALRPWTRDWRVHVAVLLCPAAVFGLISGQFAYLATALILTVLRWRTARPWAAGALLGLLALKPQLGLYFPLMLLAARDWKVIGAAAVSMLCVVGLSIAIWGTAPWLAYLSEGLGTQSRVLSDPEVLAGPFMPTVFMNLRSAGLSLDVARIGQGVASLIAAAMIVHRFIRKPAANDWNANALFLAAAVFGTPYMLSYDTLPLTAAMVLAIPLGPKGRLLLLATYFLTLLQMALGDLHIPGPALVPLLVALYFWKQPTSSTCVDQRN
jgi:hypothetical protein